MVPKLIFAYFDHPMSGQLYTIIVSGERLVFTKDQILSDTGNYFATYFFGDFAEGSRGAQELIVQKDIHLFKLIQAHLRGYRVLPLADNAIPSYMTKEVGLLNLFLEAQYYGLQQLEERIRRYMPNIVDLDTGTPLDFPRPQVRPNPPPVNLPPMKSAKRYKFGTKACDDWVWTVNDTTPEGYQVLFKDGTAPGNRFVASDCPVAHGFTHVITWEKFGTRYTLMESIPA